MLPRTQLASHAAAPARVSFQIIENPLVSASAPSADDFTRDYTASRGGRDAEIPWFKPGVFYFRRALRAADSRDRAVIVGKVVLHELEHLAQWAIARNADAPTGALGISAVTFALERTHDIEVAISLGLKTCLELERLQAWILDTLGLIPPRWVGDPSEAEEKGWESARKEKL
jgi:hypothetical protein